MKATASLMQNQPTFAMEPLPARPCWYAVQTRSRHEKRVAELLVLRKIEGFLPLYETTHAWKNGNHQVHLPLFPGYTFVRLCLADRLNVLRIHGVVRLVGPGGIPAPVPDDLMEQMRQALVSGLHPEPHSFFAIGQRVQITRGPFANREAVLIRHKNHLRVVVSIDMLERAISLDIDLSSLAPLRHGFPILGC